MEKNKNELVKRMAENKVWKGIASSLGLLFIEKFSTNINNRKISKLKEACINAMIDSGITNEKDIEDAKEIFREIIKKGNKINEP